VILLTNLLEVPAEVIAAINELRWSIELFFRFLKQVLGCQRLLRNRSEGIATHIYRALIACLLCTQVTLLGPTVNNEIAYARDRS
jgi:IS4 transposase